MSQQLYRKITTAAPATVTLTQDPDGMNAGQCVQCFDIDMTGGSLTLSLPSLTSVFFGTPVGGSAGSNASTGAGSPLYKIQGTITAGAWPRILTISAYNTEADADTICGTASVSLMGVGTAFIIYVAGRHIWGVHACNTGDIS